MSGNTQESTLCPELLTTKYDGILWHTECLLRDTEQKAVLVHWREKLEFKIISKSIRKSLSKRRCNSTRSNYYPQTGITSLKLQAKQGQQCTGIFCKKSKYQPGMDKEEMHEVIPSIYLQRTSDRNRVPRVPARVHIQQRQ